ncbi:hypothetical protein GPL15_10525 [Clostridium sp. MCC353]|uniref:InlB B-repeat-containing protein n=1 Tax=Clostridium sp. MCC353 TaxID=2592646 RepID=UPI001C00EED8|nr:leucine-rich repeat domain-containing protein [Clostridium sp. MCC353]MBT9776939.1 hypothetical protein [Clostridium sp. MCC353]
MKCKWRRTLSVLLPIAMLFSMTGMNTVSALEGGPVIGGSGLCEHHKEHTADCGYTEGMPEVPCAHEHRDECYKEVTNCTHAHRDECYGDEIPTATDSGASEPLDCAHICDEESGCVTAELDCQHKHDENCGYAPAVPGTPCTFLCGECVKDSGGQNTPPANDGLSEGDLPYITVNNAGTENPNSKDVTTYTITVEVSGGNGTASASQTSAAEGTAVTLTTTLNDSSLCKVPDITIEYNSISKKVYNKRFEMPAADVTVHVVFNEHIFGEIWDMNNAIYCKQYCQTCHVLITRGTHSYSGSDDPDCDTCGKTRTLYNITMTTEGNGTASVQSSAAAKTEVKVTATPGDPSLCDPKITIKYRGNTASVILGSFQMPAADVEMHVVFREHTPAGRWMLSNYMYCQEICSSCRNVIIRGTHIYDDNTDLICNRCGYTRSTYTITVETEGNGTASASHSSAAAGTEITLTATPDSGYQFKEWRFPRWSPDSVTNNKFTMSENHVKVVAVFEAITGQNDGYHSGDVMAFQAILDAHPSLVSGGVSRDDPASWEAAGLVKWDRNSSLKRITLLSLGDKGLTGTLDVSGLTALNLLSCINNQLTDLTGLGSLTELTDLVCVNNHLTDLTGLENLTKLEWLICANNQLTDLTGLGSLTELRLLICANNQLSELNGLGNLTKLTSLNCSNNQLTELNGLENLTKLIELICADNPYVSFTAKDGHTLTLASAVGGKVWMTGYNMEDNAVELTAKPDDGYTFQKWSALPVGAASSGNKASFTLSGTMTVAAAYESIPAGAAAVTGVRLNQANLSLYSNTTPNTATLTATVSPADAADKTMTWASGNTAVATVDQSGKVTAVGNGTAAITVTTTDGGYTAICTVSVSTYSDGDGDGDGEGGGSSSGEGSSSGGGTITVTPPATGKPDTATNAEIKVTPTAGSDGSATVTVPEKSVTDAIKAAQNAAKKTGTENNGVSVTIDAATTGGASDITATLTAGSVDALIKAGVTEVRIKSDTVTITLDLAALKAAQAVAAGAVTVSAKPVAANTLSAEAQNVIGSRPAFGFTLTSGGKPVTSFGGGWASLSIPYPPQKGEDTGKLCVVYVDDNGGVTYLTDSSYDPNTKAMLARTGHFSVYGVGYKQDTPQFSPNTGITRGVFVTALGWTQNDAGQWLYYENGKPVIGWKQVDGKWYYLDTAGLMQSGGWKQIGGKWYYLYADGSMAVNTKIDSYEVGPDGAWKES